MDRIVVVTAVGGDRPGIVASLAKAMFDLGANLDDATMTRLHNVFATMVSATLPAGKTVDDCRAALRPLADQLGLTITVQGVTEGRASAPPDHLITVYGADKPGIVYKVANRLADRSVNITDMDTRRAGSEDSAIYIVFMEIAAGDIDLTDDILSLREELQVDMTLKPLSREAL